MMVRVYVARDKGEDNDEYWLALEPADHDFDEEDDSVQFTHIKPQVAPA